MAIARLVNLLAKLEGESALAKYCDWECRDRAELLMSEIAGESHNLFYVRRQKVNERFSEEEIWELILATDGDGFELPRIAAKSRSYLAVVSNCTL